MNENWKDEAGFGSNGIVSAKFLTKVNIFM
jgi:hypothetical protein